MGERAPTTTPLYSCTDDDARTTFLFSPTWCVTTVRQYFELGLRDTETSNTDTQRNEPVGYCSRIFTSDTCEYKGSLDTAICTGNRPPLICTTKKIRKKCLKIKLQLSKRWVRSSRFLHVMHLVLSNDHVLTSVCGTVPYNMKLV